LHARNMYENPFPTVARRTGWETAVGFHFQINVASKYTKIELIG